MEISKNVPSHPFFCVLPLKQETFGLYFAKHPALLDTIWRLWLAVSFLRAEGTLQVPKATVLRAAFTDMSRSSLGDWGESQLLGLSIRTMH